MKGDVADEAVALFGGWRCNYPHLPHLAQLAEAETMAALADVGQCKLIPAAT